jgi:Flp pilus assembly protein TadG
MVKGLSARKRDRGVAAVEFAIVVNVFVWLVMGAIDFGYYFFVSEIVTNAAREGARAGSVVDTSSNVSAALDQAALSAQDCLTRGGLKSTTVTIGTSATTLSGTTGTGIQVTIAYPVGSLTGFLKPFNLPPANSNATAVMRWQ